MLQPGFVLKAASPSHSPAAQRSKVKYPKVSEVLSAKGEAAKAYGVCSMTAKAQASHFACEVGSALNRYTSSTLGRNHYLVLRTLKGKWKTLQLHSASPIASDSFKDDV